MFLMVSLLRFYRQKICKKNFLSPNFTASVQIYLSVVNENLPCVKYAWELLTAQQQNRWLPEQGQLVVWASLRTDKREAI